MAQYKFDRRETHRDENERNVMTERHTHTIQSILYIYIYIFREYTQTQVLFGFTARGFSARGKCTVRSAQQVLYYVNDAKYIAQCCGRFESRSNLYMLFNGFLLAWLCRLTISMSMRCGRSDDVAKSVYKARLGDTEIM